MNLDGSQYVHLGQRAKLAHEPFIQHFARSKS